MYFRRTGVQAGKRGALWGSEAGDRDVTLRGRRQPRHGDLPLDIQQLRGSH